MKNESNQRQPLPPKIERRLADLVKMGEFGQDDVTHCRTTYWSAREDWHTILVACYDTACQRQQRASTSAVAPAQAAA